MASSLENVKLGVCSVTFDGVDLGYTKGGVQFEVTTETYEVTIDQFGETPVSNYITGRMVRVTTPFAETTLENMQKLLPGATLITDATTPTKKKVEVTTGVGISLINTAKPLRLRPQGNTTAAEDVTIPKANTPGNVTFAYELNRERIFNCEWMGYPDVGVLGAGNAGEAILFIYGDPTADATP